MAPKNKSNEIHLTRIYDANVQTVWDAWNDPKQVGQWWGPRGFTLTTHSKELKVGGIWHYTMHGPDGVDYPNKTKYLEVEKNSRLVYDHGGSDERAPMFRVTVTFTEVKGKTKMEMSMALATPEAAEATRKHIKKAGGDSTWDRLAEYLGKTLTGKEEFFINRSFAAPMEPIFALWTDPKHIAKWLPPSGFQMEFIRAEVKIGGTTFYSMNGPGGAKMYGRMEYLKISKPDQIMYAQQFCDEHENITRHPMSPTWPETMLTTILFTAEGADQTRVTVKWEPSANASSEEVATFIAARAGMTEGWTGSFDQLENYLNQG